MLRPILLACATTAWILLLAGGFAWLWIYEGTPGGSGNTTSAWPAKSSLQRDAVAPTLVMAVHPMCACSEASITELARVMAHIRNIRVYVLAVIPGNDAGKDWDNSRLLQRARRMPDVRMIADRDGTEAKGFGARTSGFISLYDADGRLLFTGGITGSRGHEGDNAGEEALIEAARTGRPATKQSPVFGCALFSETIGDEYTQVQDGR